MLACSTVSPAITRAQHLPPCNRAADSGGSAVCVRLPLPLRGSSIFRPPTGLLGSGLRWCQIGVKLCGAPGTLTCSAPWSLVPRVPFSARWRAQRQTQDAQRNAERCQACQVGWCSGLRARCGCALTHRRVPRSCALLISLHSSSGFVLKQPNRCVVWNRSDLYGLSTAPATEPGYHRYGKTVTELLVQRADARPGNRNSYWIIHGRVYEDQNHKQFSSLRVE